MKDREMAFRREELEKLSTLDLEQILRTELDSDTPERETVLLILSILEERDPTDSTNRPEGTMESWKMTVDHAAVSTRSLDKPVRKSKKWFVPLTAAAAVVLILLMTVPQTVGAENIFQIIGRWTRDLFSLSDGVVDQDDGEYIFQTDHDGLQQLYDAVVAQGIINPIVPTWLPEGYEMVELQTFSKKPKIHARFCMHDTYVMVTIEAYKDNLSNTYPKNNESVQIIEIKNQKYYIMSNDGTWKAVWILDNVECSITTNDTEEVFKTIIQSIYRRMSI